MSVTRIQFRRGSAAEWTAENPVLNSSEPGVEEDTGQMKLGDGETPWNLLGYVGDPAAPMGTTEARTGTSTIDRVISAAVLAAAIASRAPIAVPSNVHMQPIWDGTGTHPRRGGTGSLPDGFYEIWRQPTAPLVGDEFAHEGDDWEVTQSVG